MVFDRDTHVPAVDTRQFRWMAIWISVRNDLASVDFRHHAREWKKARVAGRMDVDHHVVCRKRLRDLHFSLDRLFRAVGFRRSLNLR